MQSVRLPRLTAAADAILRPLAWVFGGLGSTVGAPRTAAKAQLTRITLAGQWQALSGTLSQAIGRAEQAHVLQAAATRQLDLAQYGLSTLMDELSAVMIVPGRRESAMVHRFEPLAPLVSNQALAA